MKASKILAYSLTVIVFVATIPCEAGGNRKNHRHNDGHHEHHHHHQYRWFGVIPRPSWAAPYYYMPQYTVPPQNYYVVPPSYPVPPSDFLTGAPTVTEVPPLPDGNEIIIIPQEPQSFGDYQKPIHIAIPEISVQERQVSVTEPTIPQPTVPRPVAPRRIDSSKAATIEKHVVGEAACPLDLPKGGIVKVCNAKSGKYKLSQETKEKYFHQQECWFCENVLGGDYVRWQERTK